MSVNRALSHRENRSIQVERIHGGAARCWGLVACDAGESRIHVPFPVEFTDRPNFVYGAELLPPAALIAQVWPTMSAMVTKWDRKLCTGVVEHFTGMHLIIVLTGPPIPWAPKAMLHWQVTGPSIVGAVPEDTE